MVTAMDSSSMIKKPELFSSLSQEMRKVLYPERGKGTRCNESIEYERNYNNPTTVTVSESNSLGKDVVILPSSSSEMPGKSTGIQANTTQSMYSQSDFEISKEMELLASKMHNQANQQLNASTASSDFNHQGTAFVPIRTEAHGPQYTLMANDIITSVDLGESMEMKINQRMDQQYDFLEHSAPLNNVIKSSAPLISYPHNVQLTKQALAGSARNLAAVSQSMQKVEHHESNPTLYTSTGQNFSQNAYKNEDYIWLDPKGREVSPPNQERNNCSIQSQTNSLKNLNIQVENSLLTNDIRKVSFSLRPEDNLGLMIRGGIEYGLGIFITGVDQTSVASKHGIKVGDEILILNNQSFRDVNHDNAVMMLKNTQQFDLVLRYVGKVPHSSHSMIKSNEFLPSDIMPSHQKNDFPVVQPPQKSERQSRCRYNPNKTQNNSTRMQFHDQEFLNNGGDNPSFLVPSSSVMPEHIHITNDFTRMKDQSNDSHQHSILRNLQLSNPSFSSHQQQPTSNSESHNSTFLSGLPILRHNQHMSNPNLLDDTLGFIPPVNQNVCSMKSPKR